MLRLNVKDLIDTAAWWRTTIQWVSFTLYNNSFYMVWLFQDDNAIFWFELLSILKGYTFTNYTYIDINILWHAFHILPTQNRLLWLGFSSYLILVVNHFLLAKSEKSKNICTIFFSTTPAIPKLCRKDSQGDLQVNLLRRNRTQEPKQKS